MPRVGRKGIHVKGKTPNGPLVLFLEVLILPGTFQEQSLFDSSPPQYIHTGPCQDHPEFDVFGIPQA